ncbi:MAG: hypothetical protein HN439_04850 [Euryarchaeota archaeon]|jgi:hypothetical protein|nr:hypothetical protein [Euryarchaeota archaeon]MBT5285261.1 hypothetical protein [Euryarchaeota archaeon]
MADNSDDSRGLDHLMEQNEAELSFLSAYGGVDSAKGEDGQAILGALLRFMRAGGLTCDQDGDVVNFDFGTAKAESDGCVIICKGSHLPLVSSDLHCPGFHDGVLSKRRDMVSVRFTSWTQEHRRFLERLVEHHRA